MKLKVISLFVCVLSMLMIHGCELNIPAVTNQRLHVRFVNSAGECLIEKNKLKLDSSVTNIVTYFVKESEYSLSVKINGVDFVADLPMIYDNYNSKREKYIVFGCLANNENLLNQRDPYTYSYTFICPKLFGDDRPRKLDVVWATRKKTVYDIIEGVLFEGKVISNGSQKDPMFIIVIE